MNKIITILRESKLARFLIPGGILLIVFGVIFFMISSKNQNFIQTEATVTACEVYEEAYTDSNGENHQATYKVDLKYTVGGKEYTGDLEGVSEYKAGDKMKIYYNPEDPAQITQTKSLLIPLAIIAGGLAMLVGGIVSAVNAVKRYRKMKEQEKEWANG